MMNNNDSPLRTRVVKNVLGRTKAFTSAQVSRVTRVSGRHTRRVLSELVSQGLVTRINGTVYLPN